MKKKSKFLNLSAKLAFCLVAACTFLFTSCYEKEDLLDTPTPGTPTVTKYIIKGTVKDAESGVELAGANVVLSGPVGATATTNTDGTYRMEVTQTGGYSINISKDDYLTATSNITVVEAQQGTTESSYIVDASLVKVGEAPIDPTYKTVEYTIAASFVDAQTGTALDVDYQVNNGTIQKGTSMPATKVEPGSYTIKASKANYYNSYATIVVAYVLIPGETTQTQTIAYNTTVALTPISTNPDPEAAQYYVEGNIKDASNGQALPATITLYKGKDIIGNIENASYYKFDVDKAIAESGTFTITVFAGNEYYAFSSNFTFPKGTSNSTVKEVVNATLAKINNQPVEGIGGTVSTIIGDKGATLSLVSTIKDGTSESQETTSIIIPDNAVDVPTAISISQLVATQEAEVASRVFEGLPSGLQFNSPLKFVFNDPFNGELTGMKVAYYNEENNSWNNEGDVTTDKSNYTAEVKHFSKFKFAFESSMESTKDKDTQTIEFPIFNNRDEAKTVPYSIAYKGGLVYDGITVAQAIANKGIEGKAADYLNGKIVNFIKSNSLNRVPGTIPTDEKAEGFLTINPLTQVNNLIFTLNYVRTVYKVTVIYKGTTTVIEVPVIDYNGHTLSVDQESIGHLHTHAHGQGSDANAGGGIVVAE